MQFLLLAGVLSLLLCEPQFPLFVNGQVQETTTTQHQMQHTHHSHHNHNRNHHHNQHNQQHHHHHHQQQQDSANFQQAAASHHTRHHHQQNNYHSNNNSRKYHVYNITNRTTATTKPVTISHNNAFTKKIQHNQQQQQTTTSSPALNNNGNNHQHHRLLQNHYHESQSPSQQQQQEFRSHHRHNHHKENQHQQFPLEGFNGIRAQKSIKSDAILRQNFVATQHNRIDVQENENFDYDDDYYQDDNEENGEGDTIENNSSYADIDTYHMQQHDGTYNDHEYARVPRDHSHHNYQSNYYRQNDRDYANDEPSQLSYEQVSALINNTKPGVLTEQKYRELGTPESVQKSRDKYQQDQRRARIEESLAGDHVRRMKVVASCNRPMPRVIYVSNETSKIYMPPVTLLHRCGEDTGCCASTAQICAVKTYENVDLYFFVVNLANERHTVKLVLHNHTACHCVDRSNLTFDSAQHRGKRSGFDLEQADGDLNVDLDAICRCPKHYDILQEDERPTMETFGQTAEQQQSNRAATQAAATAALASSATVAHGQPPAVRRSSNINCRCDCLSTNVPCQRLKDGAEGFSIEDRNCIATKKCKAPKCRFGAYNLQMGRCPRLRNHKRAVRHNDNGYG